MNDPPPPHFEVAQTLNLYFRLPAYDKLHRVDDMIPKKSSIKVENMTWNNCAVHNKYSHDTDNYYGRL